MGAFDKARAKAAALPEKTEPVAAADLLKYSNAAQAFDGINVTLGIKPMPHQEAVIEAVEKGFQSLLIADQPGVGKTLSAIGSLEAKAAYPALIVCPPTLTINWHRELSRAVPHRKVDIVSGTKTYPLMNADIVICPDSVVWAWAMQPDPNRPKHHKATGPLAKPWSALVVDESHRCKNEKAKRTRAILGISRVLPTGALRLLLSGTPMVNRPDELVAPLSILGVINTVFGSRARFLSNYCHFDNWGTVIGARNSADLWSKLTSNVMIRRLREDVLSLPPKTRVSMRAPMSESIAIKYKSAEDNLISFLRRERNDDKYTFSENSEAIVLLNTLRRLSGEAKVDAVVAYAEELLSKGEQVFIAAWHTDVVRTIWSALYKHGVVQVVGGMSADDKQKSVDAFQSGTARVLVGNIEAAGVGLTLTAARHILVAELPWNPATLQQVEDRLHRIGQTRSVTSTIFISEWPSGSVDERIFSLINTKAEMVNAVIDNLDEGMVIDEHEAISKQLLDSYR